MSPSLHAQKKMSKSKKRSDWTHAIQEKMRSDQLGAIQELAEIIEKASDEEDLTTLYQANLMLGDINFDNYLFELAIQRYSQAYGLERLIESPSGITASEKLGQAYLAIKDKRALKSFQLCIEQSQKQAQVLKCKEGLSKAHYNNQDYDAAIKILQELEKTYTETDPSSLSRVQALLAKAAAENDDLAYADENIGRAYQNFRRAKKEDYGVLQEAKEKVVEKSDGDMDVEEFFRANANVIEDKPEILAQENNDLIRVLTEEGEVKKAKEKIEESKKVISSVNSLETKADFFKQASDNSARRGDYETALEEYKKFEENQFALLTEKEEEINNRLSILESQKNVEITEKTYSSRKKLDIAEQQRSQIQKYIIYLLGLLLLGSIIGSLIIWKNLRAKNILNKKLELQSLRSQMNPHFIFNALNSVNEFIATQDERKANKYLSDFSKLMRSVLEVNQKETIDLADEINLTELYLKLEQDRFQDKFEHEFIVDEGLRHSEIQIPPQLLQPYIENAIWHGLRYRETKGKLIVLIKELDGQVKVEISDNGIGRKNSIASKTKFQKQQASTGMKNTQSRMEIVEKLYGSSFQLSIKDAFDDETYPGTLVEIKLSKK